MSRIKVKLHNIVIALAVFFIVGIAVSEILSKTIFFSLFVGIPAGFVAGIGTFLYLHMKKNK